MKKIFISLTAYLLIISVLLCSGAGVTAYGADGYTQSQLINTAQGIVNWKKSECSLSLDDNLLSGKMLDNAGSTSCDWYVIGMSRLGFKDDYSAYLAVLKNNVESRYATNGKLSPSKATEWHRISLAVLSAGGDPLSFGKDKNGSPINLIADGVYNRGKTASIGKQGINGWIWGLISVDSKNYKVPSDAFNSRDDLIAQIIKKQLPDGGFCLSGNTADPDVTAMAVQALSSYYKSDKKVKSCVDKALSCLSEIQLESGGYKCYASENAESSAQVIMALCSLGIDPQKDSRFIKNGKSALDALMKYKMSDGGFIHSKEYDQNNPTAKPGVSNSMAGEQTLLALAAVVRLMKGESKLYDFSDVKQQSEKTTKPSVKSDDVKKIDEILDKPNTDNYADVVKYIEMIENSDDIKNKDEYLKKLNEAKEKIEKDKEKIEEINEEIKENISPSDGSQPDENAIESIEEKIESLDEEDREKIENSEDLEKAKAASATNKRKIIIAVLLSVFAAGGAAFLIIRIIRKKKKKQADFIESDDEE